MEEPGQNDEPAGHLNSNALSSPSPLYFISRDSGILVPLIPVDELPFHVNLEGAPRVLQFEKTSTMKHLGVVPSSGMTYSMKIIDKAHAESHNFKFPQTKTQTRSESSKDAQPLTPPVTTPHQTLEHSIHAPQTESPIKPPKDTPSSAAEPKDQAKETKRATSTIQGDTQSTSPAMIQPEHAPIDHINAIPLATTTLPPSGKLPNEKGKVYCSHWLSKCECSFTQQGCLYKHEIPDQTTLRKMNMKVHPKCYLELKLPLPRGPRLFHLPSKKLARTHPNGTNSDSDGSANDRTWRHSTVRKDQATTVTHKNKSKPATSTQSSIGVDLIDLVDADSSDRISSASLSPLTPSGGSAKSFSPVAVSVIDEPKDEDCDLRIKRGQEAGKHTTKSASMGSLSPNQRSQSDSTPDQKRVQRNGHQTRRQHH